MHLRQPIFAYSASRIFSKIKKKIQRFKETWDSRYIYQNKLDIACFQHDRTYGGFKNLTKRRASEKNCAIMHLILLIIQNMMDIKEVLLQWFINVLNKNFWQRYYKGNKPNQQWTEEITQTNLQKLSEKKITLTFYRRHLGVDLADIQLISKINKGIRFLLRVIDIFSKYAWVIPLKNKKGITITNAFQKKFGRI